MGNKGLYVEEGSAMIIDWQQVRIQSAIAAMQGILSNPSSISMEDETVIQESAKFADALVKELKGE